MSGKRQVGPFTVTPIGLGCMELSHGYGVRPPNDEATRLLNRALDLGYDFLDTAAVYGMGANERLIAEAIGHRRGDYVLASKCGLSVADGKRVIDGRPESLLRTIDQALQRLGTEVIDLYYLHRLDRKVPVEESVGALGQMVAAGKVRAIGLSEVSAATLRRAQAVHPIAAVQNEYSPWTRNVELGLLAACRELGVSLVAYSPVARGFLADAVHSFDELVDGDLRRSMPRFQGENLARNLALLAEFRDLAAEAGCTPAQLSLAWVLSRGEDVVAIPGTTSCAHAEENLAAAEVRLSDSIIAQVEAILGQHSVAGPRYSPGMQADIDTEDYPPD